MARPNSLAALQTLTGNTPMASAYPTSPRPAVPLRNQVQVEAMRRVLGLPVEEGPSGFASEADTADALRWAQDQESKQLAEQAAAKAQVEAVAPTISGQSARDVALLQNQGRATEADIQGRYGVESAKATGQAMMQRDLNQSELAGNRSQAIARETSNRMMRNQQAMQIRQRIEAIQRGAAHAPVKGGLISRTLGMSPSQADLDQAEIQALIEKLAGLEIGGMEGDTADGSASPNTSVTDEYVRRYGGM